MRRPSQLHSQDETTPSARTLADFSRDGDLSKPANGSHDIIFMRDNVTHDKVIFKKYDNRLFAEMEHISACFYHLLIPNHALELELMTDKQAAIQFQADSGISNLFRYAEQESSQDRLATQSNVLGTVSKVYDPFIDLTRFLDPKAISIIESDHALSGKIPAEFKDIISRSLEEKIAWLTDHGLMSILAASAILQEDDAHKANIGITITHNDDETPAYKVVRIDFDMNFTPYLASQGRTRTADQRNIVGAHTLTSKDIDYFPILQDANPYYWLTIDRPLSEAVDAVKGMIGQERFHAYLPHECSAFRKLLDNSTLQKQTFHVFLKYLLIPHEFIEKIFKDHSNAKVAFYTNKRNLKQSLFSSEKFKTWFHNITIEEIRQLFSEFEDYNTAIDTEEKRLIKIDVDQARLNYFKLLLKSNTPLLSKTLILLQQKIISLHCEDNLKEQYQKLQDRLRETIFQFYRADASDLTFNLLDTFTPQITQIITELDQLAPQNHNSSVEKTNKITEPLKKYISHLRGENYALPEDFLTESDPLREVLLNNLYQWWKKVEEHDESSDPTHQAATQDQSVLEDMFEAMHTSYYHQILKRNLPTLTRTIITLQQSIIASWPNNKIDQSVINQLENTADTFLLLDANHLNFESITRHIEEIKSMISTIEAALTPDSDITLSLKNYISDIVEEGLFANNSQHEDTESNTSSSWDDICNDKYFAKETGFYTPWVAHYKFLLKKAIPDITNALIALRQARTTQEEDNQQLAEITIAIRNMMHDIYSKDTTVAELGDALTKIKIYINVIKSITPSIGNDTEAFNPATQHLHNFLTNFTDHPRDERLLEKPKTCQEISKSQGDKLCRIICNWFIQPKNKNHIENIFNTAYQSYHSELTKLSQSVMGWARSWIATPPKPIAKETFDAALAKIKLYDNVADILGNLKTLMTHKDMPEALLNKLSSRMITHYFDQIDRETLFPEYLKDNIDFPCCLLNKSIESILENNQTLLSTLIHHIRTATPEHARSINHQISMISEGTAAAAAAAAASSSDHSISDRLENPSDSLVFTV